MKDAEIEGAGDHEDEENESAVSGAHIPIPAETFLEELSQKLEVHPISVYWLVHELREKDSAVCTPELRRFVEDYVSITVLRLLGHRWPRQIESGGPLPAWADPDGIIPLTEGTGEPTLLERVRDRIAQDFGSDRVNAIEREFEAIVGKPLGPWLATEFFSRHVSQFRKRPVAWHIESARGDGKHGRRGKRNVPPAFSCLAYYHRLDADLLPKLRSQYVGPLRDRFQTELASLERLSDRTADQDARRFELEAKIEELRAFDARLEEVIVRGFDVATLATVVAKEPLDQWTSRDGSAAAPTSREALLAHERRYDPDLNDGVRVNVAPLQRAGLLAADVLASKDVEKAITDRAEWRADERRWCREGKLPRPGWWPEVTP